MKKRKNNGIFYVVISLLAVFAIAGSVAAYVVSQNVNVSGDYNYYEAEGQPNPINEGEIILGATPGPHRYSRFFSDNGVAYALDTQRMRSATTTLCSFANVFKATSTIESFDYQIIIGTSTAATLVVSSSTEGFATTSKSNIVSPQTVASGAQDSLSWNSVAINDSIIAPNSFVLLSTETVGLGGYTYGGGCQIKLRKLPN